MSLPLRPLGDTGLAVSPIGFGGAVIGIEDYLTPGDRDDAAFRDRSLAALTAAVAAGIRLFDTAPGYGAGRSESRFGEALERHRDDIVLTTKVSVRPEDDPSVWWDSLHASLDRLRTDRVDVLQLHGSTWPDELAEWAVRVPGDWLAEVRSRGLARAVGVTAEAPSGGLERMLRSGRFDVLQIAYSAIYQDACDYQREPYGVIPLAGSLGIGVLTMRSTTSGVLGRLLDTEFPGLDPGRVARLALRFVLSTPQVDCALVGMSSPTEVEANCALAADTTDRIDLRALHHRFVPAVPRASEDVRHGPAAGSGRG